MAAKSQAPSPKKSTAGRSKGSKQTVTKQARLEAASSGLLPHEWLLKVCRGEPVLHKRWKVRYHAKTGEELSRELIEEEYYPDFPMRVDAAKAAAPYYMPKLATQTVKVDGNIGLTKLTDDELKEELLKLVREVPELLNLVGDLTKPAKGKK
jgi:hypothetical protein